MRSNKIKSCILFSLYFIFGCIHNDPNSQDQFYEPLALHERHFEIDNPPNSRQTRLEQKQIIALQQTNDENISRRIKTWSNPIVKWNQLARELVAKNKTNPLIASRIYTLLSIAQHDAMMANRIYQIDFKRIRPADANKDILNLGSTQPEPYSYPSTDAVISQTSVHILNEFFTKDRETIDATQTEHLDICLRAGINYPSDFAAGKKIGSTIAEQLLILRQDDGFDQKWENTVPTEDGQWVGQNPLLPLWGTVRPWLTESLDSFAVLPPPKFGSAGFNQALSEVRVISDMRTQKQIEIANFWADGAGTVTPPGHWNQIASDLLIDNNMGVYRSARILSIMNMAIMDAGISCWQAKYTYWLIRPSQADPQITLSVALPNFPSYPSGHSSFSGAASEVLKAAFPEKNTEFDEMANEAAISRVYGGIHYRFDSDEGLKSGRAIGRFAVSKFKEQSF